jgi:Ca2+-binding RTX toxin-like protein
MRKFILAAILVAMAFAIVLVSGTVSPVVGQVIAPFSPSFPCARPTIAGTAGNDIRLGTHGPDVIDGREGKDIIAGLGGDDIICGGDDNDLLIGGNGNDTLDGGTGIDILHGNAGNDTIVIRAGDVPDGAEVINGGSGVDTLVCERPMRTRQNPLSLTATNPHRIFCYITARYAELIQR